MPAPETARTDTPRSVLTTTSPAFMDAACSSSRPLNHQPQDTYSGANHSTWRFLYSQMCGRWADFATDRYLEGLEHLNLQQDRVPHLDRVNAFLAAHSGFRAEATSGHMPAFDFFDGLHNRKLSTATAIRDTAALEYLSERDIFHDVAGHVPMHADRTFAEVLVALGTCAHTVAEIATSIRDAAERQQRLNSMLKALARFYWFTVENGLVRYGNHVKVYGSGLLSSASQIERAVGSPQVQRCDLSLDWVVHQPFEIGKHQPLLFIVESFDHLLELTATLERCMREGRLDHVSGGNPEVSAADLESFLSPVEPSRSSPLRTSHPHCAAAAHRKRSAQLYLPPPKLPRSA